MVEWHFTFCLKYCKFVQHHLFLQLSINLRPLQRIVWWSSDLLIQFLYMTYNTEIHQDLKLTTIWTFLIQRDEQICVLFVTRKN